MRKKTVKILALLLCLCLLFEQSGFAQVAGELDISGRILQLRNSFTQDKFRPLHLRYLSYDNLNNNFKLLLDKGDFMKGLSQTKMKGLSPCPAVGGAEGTDPEEKLKDETRTLLNYFFIGITLPNESFWVNLRPDAENQIIDDELAKTDIGKILLEQDLQLKKDTAKFTSPETPEGKEYWDKLYKKAEELFGSSNITIPTLTRPWIVPDEIIIRETPDNAYVYKATLKVMLEEDYLAKGLSPCPAVGGAKGTVPEASLYSFHDPRLKELNAYSSQLIREGIIPKLTKEINTAKRYAPLRQVYYSLILAQWFKQRFYGKGGLYSWLIDKKNLNGLTSKERWSKTTYFKEYQRSFKEGEYNIKEPVYTPLGQTIRSYMSGGMNLAVTMPGPAKLGEVSQSAASPVTIVGASPTRNAPRGNAIVGAEVEPPNDPNEPYSGRINTDAVVSSPIGLATEHNITPLGTENNREGEGRGIKRRTILKGGLLALTGLALSTLNPVKVVADTISATANPAVKVIERKEIESTTVYFVEEIPREWIDITEHYQADIVGLAITKRFKKLLLDRGIREIRKFVAPSIFITKKAWDDASEIEREAFFAHERAHLELEKIVDLITDPDELSVWYSVLNSYLLRDLTPEIKKEIEQKDQIYQEYLNQIKSQSLSDFIRSGGISYLSLPPYIKHNISVKEALDELKKKDEKAHKELVDALNKHYIFLRRAFLIQTLGSYLGVRELFARHYEFKHLQKRGYTFDNWLKSHNITFSSKSTFDYFKLAMEHLWAFSKRYDILEIYKEEIKKRRKEKEQEGSFLKEAKNIADYKQATLLKDFLLKHPILRDSKMHGLIVVKQEDILRISFGDELLFSWDVKGNFHASNRIKVNFKEGMVFILLEAATIILKSDAYTIKHKSSSSPLEESTSPASSPLGEPGKPGTSSPLQNTGKSIPGFVEISATGKKVIAAEISYSQGTLSNVERNTSYKEPSGQINYQEDFPGQLLSLLRESADTAATLQMLRPFLQYIIANYYRWTLFNSPDFKRFDDIRRIYEKIQDVISTDGNTRRRLLIEIRETLEHLAPHTFNTVMQEVVLAAVLELERNIRYDSEISGILNFIAPFTLRLTVDTPMPVSIDRARGTVELNLFAFLPYRPRTTSLAKDTPKLREERIRAIHDSDELSHRSLRVELRRIAAEPIIENILARSGRAIPRDILADIVLILLEGRDLNEPSPREILKNTGLDKQRFANYYYRSKYLWQLSFYGNHRYVTLLRQLARDLTVAAKIERIYKYLDDNFGLAQRYNLSDGSQPSLETIKQFIIDNVKELERIRYAYAEFRIGRVPRSSTRINEQLGISPLKESDKITTPTKRTELSSVGSERVKYPEAKRSWRTPWRTLLRYAAAIAAAVTLIVAVIQFTVPPKDAVKPAGKGISGVSEPVTPNIYRSATGEESTEQRIQRIVNYQPTFRGLNPLAHRPFSGAAGFGGTVIKVAENLFTLSGYEANEMFITGLYNAVGEGGFFIQEGQIKILPEGSPTSEETRVTLTLAPITKGGRVRLPTVLNGQIVPGSFADGKLSLDRDGVVTANEDTGPATITYAIRKWDQNGRVQTSQPVTEWMQREFQDLPADIRKELDQARLLPEKERLNVVARLLNRKSAYSAGQHVRLSTGTWNKFLDDVLRQNKHFVSDCDVLSMLAFLFNRYLGLETVFVLGYSNAEGSRGITPDKAHGTLIVRIEGKWVFFETTAMVPPAPETLSVSVTENESRSPDRPIPPPTPVPSPSQPVEKPTPEPPQPLLSSKYHVEEFKPNLKTEPTQTPSEEDETKKRSDKIINLPGFFLRLLEENPNIRTGDVLTRIAETYYGNGSVEMARRLAEDNNISNPDEIYAGDSLNLPQQLVHVVKEGDTFNGIARLYNIKPKELVRMNQRFYNDRRRGIVIQLFPGDTIVVAEKKTLLTPDFIKPANSSSPISDKSVSSPLGEPGKPTILFKENRGAKVLGRLGKEIPLNGELRLKITEEQDKTARHLIVINTGGVTVGFVDVSADPLGVQVDIVLTDERLHGNGLGTRIVQALRQKLGPEVAFVAEPGDYFAHNRQRFESLGLGPVVIVGEENQAYAPSVPQKNQKETSASSPLGEPKKAASSPMGEREFLAITHNPELGIINDPDFIEVYKKRKGLEGKTVYAIPVETEVYYRIAVLELTKSPEEIAQIEKIKSQFKRVVIFDRQALIKRFDNYHLRFKYAEMILFHENIHVAILGLRLADREELKSILWKDAGYAKDVADTLGQPLSLAEWLPDEFITNLFSAQRYGELQRIDEQEKTLNEAIRMLANDDRGKELWETVRRLNIVTQAEEKTKQQVAMILRGPLLASSPLTEETKSIDTPADKGGIDLRALPIVTQPMGILKGQPPSSFRDSPLRPAVGGARGQSLNLDAEWRQIENMTQSGLIPSNERIREYLEASCQAQDCNKRLDKVLSLLADILRLEEERVSATEPALREFLVLLESDKSANELQLALSKVEVLPKEPTVIEP